MAAHCNRQALLLLALAQLVCACANNESDSSRDTWNPPADRKNGFVGLFNVNANMTACGNCHVGVQNRWAATGHAQAFAGLVNSGNARPECYGCHTVSERGNRVGLSGAPGGWNVVEAASYRNVQCESCHGPGLQHVSVPDNAATFPQARVGIRDSAASCAACHSTNHFPYTEQWAKSGHADSAGMAGPSQNTACQGCHEGRAAIRRFSGRSGRFVEAGFPAADNMTITCAVCHDPHGSPNTAQLRAPINSPDIAVNLCTACHNRNAQPGAAFTVGARGPHSVQGGVYFGQGAGWYPPGFAVDTALVFQSSHLGRNPGLCAGCHVAKFSVTDPDNPRVVFNSTGHLFAAAPCLGPDGIPTADTSCAYTSTARSWAGCSTAGCHTPDAAAGLFRVLDGRVTLLVDQLWDDRNGNQVLDPAPTDGGYLATVRANFPGDNTAAFCCTVGASDGFLSVAEGALWNARMLGRKLDPSSDRSSGVHNSVFYQALLAATISSVQSTYGLPAARTDVAQIMAEALAHSGVHYEGRRMALP